ncbi:hypothetical protein, partial [Frankia sp. Cj3]|uniref:hypothetical protein n=1 Tax=Frankia sp. Cj3 TaxID=2880976 RepID=UPI001EF49DC8
SRPIEPPVTDTLPIYLPSSALTRAHGDRSKNEKSIKAESGRARTDGPKYLEGTAGITKVPATGRPASRPLA